jgi:hydroxypyruvate reductase
VIPRAVCEEAFRAAVIACDPGAHVHAAMQQRVPRGRAIYGIAVGKAALAMARAAGPVVHGIAVAPQLDGRALPLGWTARDAAHPLPDERSVAAGATVLDVVRAAEPDDLVLALVSGGASALIEQPTVPLAELRTRIEQAMASAMPIRELNELRGSLSKLKHGRLAAASRAPVVTLAVSDVIGDDLHVIGSGPTVPCAHAEVLVPMRAFAEAMHARLSFIPLHRTPVQGLVEIAARELGPGVWWGEPTMLVPEDHGEGGRAQQLALELAALLSGTDLSAFVAGSDGVDGPPPKNRPAPAGAYVDGTTWDAIVAAGIDPAEALARRDAGTALAAVGALVITGPTGINHADVAVVG